AGTAGGCIEHYRPRSCRNRHRTGADVKDQHLVTLNVNGQESELLVESRKTLADVLRDDLGLTGTHLGCEHGICGACTVLMDGEPIRACLVFGVQADGRDLRTVESLADGDELRDRKSVVEGKSGES